MEAAGCLSVRAASVKGVIGAASLSMLEVQFVGASQTPYVCESVSAWSC